MPAREPDLKHLRIPACCLVAAVLFVIVPLPARAQAGKVEALGAPTDPLISESIRRVLAPKGYRILPEAGAAIELWYRAELPAQPKAANSDAVYDRLAESALVGVLHIAQVFNDYRGHSLQAGFYALRYALMPNDGNHLGVAPSRDFLLLIPIVADPGPEKSLKFQDLVALSRQASGTKHPAPMSLAPAESGSTAPALTKDDEGHVIFTTVVRLSTAEDLTIALVVKGTAPQ